MVNPGASHYLHVACHWRQLGCLCNLTGAFQQELHVISLTLVMQHLMAVLGPGA